MDEKNRSPWTQNLTRPGNKEHTKTGITLFPVVVIAIAAGGLEAFWKMLGRLPHTLGMSYVLVQHRSDGQVAITPKMLENKTKMKVVLGEFQSGDRIPLEKDQIYILPPNVYSGALEGELVILSLLSKNGDHHPIDFFLISLAETYKAKSVAIILSGDKATGTAGIRAIRKAGGITFAQDDTASYQEMPRHAVASGYIDFVLAPEQIADHLATLSNHGYTPGNSATIPANKIVLNKILLLLSDKYQKDFSQYDEDSIIRRIQRRVILHKKHDFESYYQFLFNNDTEVNLLYKDLLLDVIPIFRQPSLYRQNIRKLLPFLVKHRGDRDPIKVWIPECDTGEEAYSIAICLLECWKDKALDIPLKIFATGLSSTDIKKARKGLYTASALQNMPARIIKSYFGKIDGLYCVDRKIRELCIFATHDLLKDPPFPAIDILFCENAILRLNTGYLKKVIQAFHYALKKGGYLLPGRSDGGDELNEFFNRLEQDDAGIYTKKQVRVSWVPDLPLHKHVSQHTGSEKEVDKILLSRYVPPSILVDKDCQIIHFYGSVSSYLRPDPGKASMNLFKMIRDELIFELQPLLDKVKCTGLAAKKEKIRLSDRPNSVAIEVIPVTVPSLQAQMLIIIQDTVTYGRQHPSRSDLDSVGGDEKDRRIRQLEKELQRTQQQMLSISEAFDKTREELQTAHEEVLSSNEELQSINGQLETSRQELHFANDGLTAMNEELRTRNKELREMAEYAETIVEAIREPILILNNNLRVNMANHSFYSYFKLHPDTVEGNYLHSIGDGLFDKAAINEPLAQLLADKYVFQQSECKLKLQEAAETTLLLNLIRMNGRAGRRTRILVTMEDITNRTINSQKPDLLPGTNQKENFLPGAASA